MNRIKYFGRALARACVVILSTAVFLSANAAQPSRPTTETRHPSGISIVGAGSYQPRPANKAQELAYHNALRAAQANPDDLGYPWLDSKGLIQRNITPKGFEIANRVRAAVARQTVPARFSYKQLERIKDEVIELPLAGFVGADAIWETEPDERNNRVIITISRLDDTLLNRLAEVYGTQAIAIRVTPYPKGLGLLRQDDHAPYAGGAAYFGSNGGGCTLGFAFTTGFVTAGHCETASGNASTNYDIFTKIGRVDAAHLNWVWGTGTVSFPGHNEEYVQRGDLALITAPSESLLPRIYMGTANSGLTREVSEMFWRESLADDKYCTSGKMTGQLCDWNVVKVRTNIAYWENGTFQGHAKNVTKGERSGQGVIKGDSGGPVYAYDANWSVSAKGITSGGSNALPKSTHYFTEIRQAYEYFPGELLTQAPAKYLRNDNSHRCLAIPNDSDEEGMNATQWGPCIRSQSQTWYMEPILGYPGGTNWVHIKNGSGLCLSVSGDEGGNAAGDGKIIHQWTCYPANLQILEQFWQVQPDGTIMNGLGKCLSVADSSVDNWAVIHQWKCAGVAAQKWTWSPM